MERDTYLMFGFALFIIISHCGQYCSVRKCFIMQLWQTGKEKKKKRRMIYQMRKTNINNDDDAVCFLL